MASIYTSCERMLLLIVLTALAVRVGFVLSLPNDLIWGDSEQYHQVAINILAGHGAQLDENSVAFRPPGYPYFLAAVYKFSDYRNLLPVRLIQALLSALVVWQVFAIAARLFGREAGLLAALLVVFDPFQVYFSGMILNETVFISLLLLLVYSVMRLRDDWCWLAASGVCAGIGCLFKPSLWYLAIFFLPFLGIAWSNWRRAVVAVVGIFVIQLIVVSPWMLRNQQKLGVYTMGTMSGRSLFEALGKGATGGPAMNIVNWPAVPDGLNEAGQDSFLKSAAIQHARENPGWALRLSVRKFSRFWSPILNFSAYRSWKYNLMSAGWYVPVMILFFVAAWRHRGNWRTWIWLLVPVIYFTLLHSLFVGSVRYRTPIMPLICCVAGAAFVSTRNSELAKR